MLKCLGLCVCLIALMSVGVSAGAITSEDLRREVSLSDPQLSPNGDAVVYVRARKNFEQNRYDTDLMLVDVNTKLQRQLTNGRLGVSMPRWASDGTRLAFLALVKSGADDQVQLFVLSLKHGDPVQITTEPRGVQSYAWSPDGERIAYVCQNENPKENEIKQNLDGFEVNDNDYLHTSETMPSHLWVMPASGGPAHRLSDGSWSLATEDPDEVSDPSWSPDGKSIAVVRFPTPLFGDSLGSVVDIIDSESGSIKRLTSNTGLMKIRRYSRRGRIPTLRTSGHTNGDAMNGVRRSTLWTVSALPVGTSARRSTAT